jgi:hypothetical protein
MRYFTRLIGLLAIVATATSCGNTAQTGASPVYLVIDSLGAAQGNKPQTFFGSLVSDVLTIVTAGGTCTVLNPCPTVYGDLGQATIRLQLKNIGSTASPNVPTANNVVTITRVHVQYRRADGRNTPGVDVPFSFDGAATGTVPAVGALTLSFSLVRNVAKEESPLVQLISSPVIITTIADVTFYGKDQVGNDVSVTGSIQIDFGNFGDS